MAKDYLLAIINLGRVYKSHKLLTIFTVELGENVESMSKLWIKSLEKFVC
jgi:hypothetical protein